MLAIIIMIYQVVFHKAIKDPKVGMPWKSGLLSCLYKQALHSLWSQVDGSPRDVVTSFEWGEPSVCSFLSWSNSLTSWHSKVSVGVQPQGWRHWRVTCKIKPFSKLYKILLAIIMWLFVRMLLHTNLDTPSFLRFSSKTKSRVMKSCLSP